MKLPNEHADLLIPDGTPETDALARTTHLGIGAHQDDLEIMAVHGILTCFGRGDLWFTGVTCTNGAGSARTGVYADYSNEDMTRVRQEEQRTAARVGRYAAVAQLNYASSEAKDAADRRLEDDLYELLRATRPQTVYTHNPADKHATHIACAVAALRALRRLPEAERPAEVYGCEVWRDLDWLPDTCKIPLNVGGRDNLCTALIGVYDSQIAGGKRYDLASAGRRRANATYFESHGVDTTEEITFALDLMPVIRAETFDPAAYVGCLIDDFRTSVVAQLEPYAKV